MGKSLSSLEKDNQRRLKIGKWVYKRDWKKKPGDAGQWPQSKKTEAVLTWMTCGNLTTTSALVGVGYPTLKLWKRQPWWKEAIQGFHDDDKTELDARYQKIIRKALTVVEDRLDNGNFQLDQKTGKILRIPVALSESHRVAKDLVAQQQILRQEKTQEVQVNETINDKLVKLASQFAEMAMGKAKTVNTYDMVEEQTALEAPQGDKTASVIPEVGQTLENRVESL